LSRQYEQQSASIGQGGLVRVGVHLGDVAVAPDGDVYGDTVNAAARIQEAAAPGQVVVSQDVRRQLRSRPEFRFEDLGQHSLKGIGPIELHAANVENDSTKFSSVSSTPEGSLPGEEKQELHSLAVLPFTDLSPERDQEYFADGIAEEILNALAKLGELHVAARTSSFAFRGTSVDAREIGRRLGVDALLEGSIRKAGNRVQLRFN
jgi:adenylate cyclase